MCISSRESSVSPVDMDVVKIRRTMAGFALDTVICGVQLPLICYSLTYLLIKVLFSCGSYFLFLHKNVGTHYKHPGE